MKWIIIFLLLMAQIGDSQQSVWPAVARPQIKTRLDHLFGTNWVLVISYLPGEIVSITCDKWTMLGINSWKHQNDFTLPGGGLTVSLLDAKGFDGYCKQPGSIKAHTDDGDFVGTLDRGDGAWKDSTELTFSR